MTIKEINELLAKGFTPEFIMKIEAQPVAAPDPQPQPAAAPDPQPQPAAAPDPQPQPAAAQAFPDFAKQVKDMQNAMDGFIKNLQQANINTVTQPGPVAETADQILAQIINPRE